MTVDRLPLDILYEDDHTLVMQTHAGHFDKFGAGELYGEFNVGLHVKDTPKTVLLRRAQLLNQLDCYGGIECIYWLNQVHGNAVVDVDGLDHQKLLDADALISRRSQTALAIMTADCVPVAVFDGRGNIACIHAGWQGLANGIIAKTVQASNFGSQPKAIIGACISQAAYQIDGALADRIIDGVILAKLVAMDAQALHDAIVFVGDDPSGDENNKVHIDIAKLARLQLEHLGVTVINESVPCSYQLDKYYSYRAQTHAKKLATGRMAMLIATKKTAKTHKT